MHDIITNLGAIITALTVLLVALGGGLRFVWKKVENRFLDIEKKLSDCQARDAKKDKQLEALVLCVRLTVHEIERLDQSGNYVLSQVRDLLARHFPLDTHIPGDMQSLLDRMP